MYKLITSHIWNLTHDQNLFKATLPYKSFKLKKIFKGNYNSTEVLVM